MKHKLQIIFSILFLAVSQIAFAQGPPQGMNYQAIARDGSGNALINHNLGIQVTIKDTTGNTIVYRETFNKTTNQFGLFVLNIGSGTPNVGTFASINWATVTPWMRVELDLTGGTTYSTNMGTSQLLSTPYALYAKSAGGSTQWTTSGNNIYNNNSGNIGIGTTTPTAGKLDVFPTGSQIGIYDSSASTTVNGSTPIMFAYTASNNGIAIEGQGSGTGTAIAGFSDNGYGSYGQSSTNDGVFGISTSGAGVDGESTSGFGVFGSSSTSAGVFGVSSSSNGVYGKSTSGIAIYGRDSLNIGVVGFSTSGVGVHGESTSDDGVDGFSTSAAGVYGQSTSNEGVIGFSTSGDGVNGQSTGANADGVFGFASGNSSVGVFGLSKNLNQSYGVYGEADSTGIAVGVYGVTKYIGGSQYAGYFVGKVVVTDSIHAKFASSSMKAFKIDHPLDPTNKYLYHSSIESNDMMNIYNGNITTDANGEAVVTLPSYFEVLNKDFKYQLTVMGQFAQAIVKDEIANNQFTIKTDKPNVKVSWQVAGVRHDPVAEMYRIVPEVEKTGIEKGKYLNPEAYGLPASYGTTLPHIVLEKTNNLRKTSTSSILSKNDDASQQLIGKVSAPANKLVGRAEAK